MGEGEQRGDGEGDSVFRDEHIELSMNSVVGLTTP